MWKSYIQHHAICHGGATPRPSQTSNASFREHSSLCVRDRPHVCTPGATAPAPVTGSTATPAPPPSPQPPPPPRPISTPAEDFQRGVRRDISHCGESKRDDQWDEWSRTFIATINTHGCKNVIKPRYVAVTTDAQGLLDSQKEFAHTTLIKALETDYGRSLVRRHEITKDSQRIWELLQLCCTDSMISIHRAQQLMKKIDSFCVPETGRTKGVEACLDEWLDCIRGHDKLTTPTPDDTKLEMLRMITGTTKGLGQLVSTAMVVSGLAPARARALCTPHWPAWGGVTARPAPLSNGAHSQGTSHAQSLQKSGTFEHWSMLKKCDRRGPATECDKRGLAGRPTQGGPRRTLAGPPAWTIFLWMPR